MSIEAIRQALEAWDAYDGGTLDHPMSDAMEALRVAIKQAKQQEPVCEVLNERGEVDYISYVPPVGTPLFTAPRQWVGLTDEDWKQLWDEFDSLDIENDFQDHMVGKYGEGHYTDVDMYWQFQQQMIKQMVNAKLEEKNSG